MTDLDRSDFIQIRNLTKSFIEAGRRRLVVDDLSGSFPKGEFSAIIGKSGAGKSTLLNLISGIDRADQGEIWLNGTDLISLGENQRTLFRRKHIGFIFQFFNLIPTLSVWENVILPLELSNTKDAQAISRAEEFLDYVGLLDRRDTFPDRLSGGEQQRIAIARALVHQPLLVLADEPTGNLDDETGHQVLSLIDRLTRKAGNNLILVTHSPEAASFADRTFYLKEGKLSMQVSSEFPGLD